MRESRWVIVDMIGKRNKLRAEHEGVASKLKELEAASSQLNPKALLAAMSRGWREIAQAVTELKDTVAAKGVELSIEWNEWSQAEWHRAIRYFVDRIVVQDDGSLTVEGLLTAGEKSVASPRPRSSGTG